MAVFENTWAIVELMGHNRIAGLVSEAELGGTVFLRIDVPEVENIAGFTKFYGTSAVYAITPTDEDTAREAVKHFRQRPIETWILPDRIKEPEEKYVDDDYSDGRDYDDIDNIDFVRGDF